MTATAENQIPTTVLPATLVKVPATATYKLKGYFLDEENGRNANIQHVDLYREGKRVARAYNRGDGGVSGIEIVSKGDEEMSARETPILQGWMADFDAAGLQYHLYAPSMGIDVHRKYTEWRIADVLLSEARRVRELNRKRVPHFAENLGHAGAGSWFTFPGTSGATTAWIQEVLERNPGIVVWSKDKQEWTDRLA